MHLWQVTSTESGAVGREYRCQRCGVVYHDSQRDRAPDCIAPPDATLRDELAVIRGTLKTLVMHLDALIRRTDGKP
jgi:hypothetical protein